MKISCKGTTSQIPPGRLVHRNYEPVHDEDHTCAFQKAPSDS